MEFVEQFQTPALKKEPYIFMRCYKEFSLIYFLRINRLKIEFPNSHKLLIIMENFSSTFFLIYLIKLK